MAPKLLVYSEERAAIDTPVLQPLQPFGIWHMANTVLKEMLQLENKSKFMFGLSELVRQMDSIHTLNVNHLYCLNRINGNITNKMNRNYTGNELSDAVKLHAAVLGVTDIVCTHNCHFNIPTYSTCTRPCCLMTHTLKVFIRMDTVAIYGGEDNSIEQPLRGRATPTTQSCSSIKSPYGIKMI